MITEVIIVTYVCILCRLDYDFNEKTQMTSNILVKWIVSSDKSMRKLKRYIASTTWHMYKRITIIYCFAESRFAKLLLAESGDDI